MQKGKKSGGFRKFEQSSDVETSASFPFKVVAIGSAVSASVGLTFVVFWRRKNTQHEGTTCVSRYLTFV